MYLHGSVLSQIIVAFDLTTEHKSLVLFVCYVCNAIDIDGFMQLGTKIIILAVLNALTVIFYFTYLLYNGKL